MYVRLIILVVGGVLSGLLLQQPVFALGDKFTPGGSRRAIDLVTDDLQLFNDHPLQSISAKADLERRVKQEEQDNKSSSYLKDLDLLGCVRCDQEDTASAQSIFRKALDLKEQIHSDDASIAASYHNLGAVAELRKENSMAALLYKKALALWETSGKASNSLLLRMRLELGDFYNSQGRESYADAEDVLKRAVNMKVAHAEAADWNYAKNLLGRVLESEGKIEEAKKYDKLKI